MYELPIDRSKVREFARATHTRNPAYDGEDAIIPPTFLVTGTMFWQQPDDIEGEPLDFTPERVLHGEQEYTFHGPPPRVGTTLTGACRIGERWEKEGRRGGTMRFAQIVTEFRDPTGALVAEQCTTVIETARPPKEG